MSARAPHPFYYTLLILPFGAVGGFVSVGLAFLATTKGLTVEDGAALVAAGLLPHTWKFVWAPVADTTLSRRIWYVLSVALCALGVLAMSVIPLEPGTLRLLQGVNFVTNLASTTLGMAVEGMMAHLTPEERRGQAGGWFQAGNLGGNGVGGGAGLWLLTHMPAPWIAGAVLAAVFAACAIPLAMLPDVQRDARTGGLVAAMGGVLKDLWEMIRSRGGQFAAILCFLPISTGAAAGVLAQAEVAKHWGAGAAEVGTVNGFLAGLIMAVGSLVGGELCARFDSRKVYAAVGALMAGIAVAMAVSPATPTSFIAWGLIYGFCVGLAYASFTGFVLQVIGTAAVATKYNIFASLSNTPIMYMGLVLASATTAWGATGMLAVEALAGIVGLGVLGLAAVVLREQKVEKAAA